MCDTNSYSDSYATYWILYAIIYVFVLCNVYSRRVQSSHSHETQNRHIYPCNKIL